MNQALHFAWWLTVPGSDDEFIQLYAVGASRVVSCAVGAGGTTFKPKPTSQLNQRMPATFWWPAKRELYTAHVTFEDGTVIELPPLDMSERRFTEGENPQLEHRTHMHYRIMSIKRPIVAIEPFGTPKNDLWVHGCDFVGGGLDKVDNWFPGWRRVYVTECTFSNCMNGPQGGNVELVRGANIQNIGGDAISDARVVWGAAVSEHSKGRADLHPDTFQFRSRGPKLEPKLLAGIRDYSTGSQGIFADRSTRVLNAAIVHCHIGTDGVGAALALEGGVENLLIDGCNFIGPRRIEGSRSNVMIRNTPGVS